MIGDASGAFLKLFGIGLRPPILQIPFGVELASLVVETVGEFMPDGRSRISVIGSIVQFGIEQRRLQHTGWEVDVIHLRIVVGIHCRWRHLPFPAIKRLPYFLQLPFGFEDRRSRCVPEEIAACN